MAAKDISTRDLATITGLSYCYVSNLISGSKVSIKGIEKIIDALGMKGVLSDIESETINQETAHGTEAT